MFSHLKTKDTVIRSIAGLIDKTMTISEVDEQFIHCGPWKFDKHTGAEIDEELGWDNEQTGSFLKL